MLRTLVLAALIQAAGGSTAPDDPALAHGISLLEQGLRCPC
jgi:hypothetical protein